MKSLLTGLVIAFSFSNAFAAKPTDGLPEAVAKYHLAITGSECDADLDMASESYDLGQGHKLHIVPCMMGAYQGSYKVYLSTKDLYPSQVAVLAYEDGLVASLDLMEASYDAKKGLLYTFAKGRGLADCGQASTTRIKVDKYGSVSIKTIEISSKLKCDGKMSDWPVVFKQK